MNTRNTLIAIAALAALITGVWFFGGSQQASAQRGMGSGGGHMMNQGEGGMMGPGGYGMMGSGRGGMMGPGMGMMMQGGSPAAMAMHMEMRMHGWDDSQRDTVIDHAHQMLQRGHEGWSGMEVPNRDELNETWDRMRNYSDAWNHMHNWMQENHDFQQDGYRDGQRQRDGSGRGMGQGMQRNR